MPQKKNPDALELLRGKIGRVAGAAHALEFILKGLSLAYNKDLQESQEPVFAAVDATLGSLEVATGFMQAVNFDLNRMATAATTGYLNATAAARYLVSKGVPFRLAHSAVGQAVRVALDKRCELEGLTLQELRSIRPEFDQDFYPALQLQAVLQSHNVPGGTAPERVAEALRSAQERVRILLSTENRETRFTAIP
jgi:argininosuccinate lyase